MHEISAMQAQMRDAIFELQVRLARCIALTADEDVLLDVASQCSCGDDFSEGLALDHAPPVAPDPVDVEPELCLPTLDDGAVALLLPLRQRAAVMPVYLDMGVIGFLTEEQKVSTIASLRRHHGARGVEVVVVGDSKPEQSRRKPSLLSCSLARRTDHASGWRH